MVDQMGGKRIIGLLVLPFLIVGMFGVSFESGGTKDIPITIVNLDVGSPNGSISEAILADMRTRDTVRIVDVYDLGVFVSDPSDFASDEIAEREVSGVIVFSTNFTSDVLAAIAAHSGGPFAMPASLSVVLDGSNPMAKGAVLGDLQIAVQFVLGTQYNIGLPVRVSPTILYSNDVDQRDFMGPGIIGVVVFLVSLIPAMGGMNASESKSCPSMKSNPGVYRSLTHRAMPLALVGIMQACVVLGTMLLFPVEAIGSNALVLAMLVLLVFASNGLGLLLAAIVRDDFSKLFPLIPLIMFASIMLSGIIIPLESIPSFLLPVSYFIPLTYAIDGCRGVMLRDYGLDEVAIDIVAIILYIVVTYALAYIVLRRGKA